MGRVARRCGESFRGPISGGSGRYTGRASSAGTVMTRTRWMQEWEQVGRWKFDTPGGGVVRF